MRIALSRARQRLLPEHVRRNHPLKTSWGDGTETTSGGPTVTICVHEPNAVLCTLISFAQGDMSPRTARTRGSPTAYGAGRYELSTDSAEKSSTSLMRKDKSSRRPQVTSPALQRFVQT